ncbi:MAG TPA: hypothetical protein VFV86_04200 [Nitrososphaeraceae archaeon]|nr:hypothetical protein [Nitrososphaeraceae archaeon]
MIKIESNKTYISFILLLTILSLCIILTIISSNSALKNVYSTPEVNEQEKLEPEQPEEIESEGEESEDVEQFQFSDQDFQLVKPDTTIKSQDIDEEIQYNSDFGLDKLDIIKTEEEIDAFSEQEKPQTNSINKLDDLFTSDSKNSPQIDLDLKVQTELPLEVQQQSPAFDLGDISVKDESSNDANNNPIKKTGEVLDALDNPVTNRQGQKVTNQLANRDTQDEPSNLDIFSTSENIKKLPEGAKDKTIEILGKSKPLSLNDGFEKLAADEKFKTITPKARSDTINGKPTVPTESKATFPTNLIDEQEKSIGSSTSKLEDLLVDKSQKIPLSSFDIDKIIPEYSSADPVEVISKVLREQYQENQEGLQDYAKKLQEQQKQKEQLKVLQEKPKEDSIHKLEDLLIIDSKNVPLLTTELYR